MSQLKDQTTKIGLESSSSHSYIRQSEYENSSDYQTDTFPNPSQEFLISNDNSENNRKLTLESDILSIADSINLEDRSDLRKYEKQHVKLLNRKMKKKKEGEIYEIDSEKRKKTDEIGSQLGIMISNFKEGMNSPKSLSLIHI